MTEEYWVRFTESGKIEDYLNYKQCESENEEEPREDYDQRPCDMGEQNG